MFVLSLRLTAVALFALAVPGCTNNCPFAYNGACDEPALCAAGSDSADCRGGGGGACTDSCTYAGDGECDDGGPSATTSVCDLGTDCTDCGAR